MPGWRQELELDGLLGLGYALEEPKPVQEPFCVLPIPSHVGQGVAKGILEAAELADPLAKWTVGSIDDPVVFAKERLHSLFDGNPSAIVKQKLGLVYLGLREMSTNRMPWPGWWDRIGGTWR